MKPNYKLGVLVSGNNDLNETVTGQIIEIRTTTFGHRYLLKNEFDSVLNEDQIVTAYREIKARVPRKAKVKQTRSRAKERAASEAAIFS